MWRIKQFMPKEHSGLEGRTVDIGNLKIHIRNPIAEGGFSCVYLARDAINGSKQYALKHIICNDEESLELVRKEISVMKSLRGHPNVVTLRAQTILDMGRTKEALLVMDYCDKSLVNVLESRGAGYFEDKQILVMFRDVCNAVFAMHCQSLPLAHRDLKAENLLLGSDGLWKLCDFGSTSTNHKRFEKPEEMGIEEDNIRKHTTPAYRAPEMWDLLLREVINEKVDIWALGCLLFRICYFKSAFDGESKLQILNGNYRIPELPKYCSSITDLIRDMLQSSPDARPDITQVWFRVNGLLPDGLQKSLPDRPPEMIQADMHEGHLNPTKKSNPMPRRSPPPPPTTAESSLNASLPTLTSRTDGGGGPLGAFWTTQHVNDSVVDEEISRPKFDEEPTSHSSSRHERSRPDRVSVHRTSLSKDENPHSRPVQKTVHGKPGPSKDFEMNLFQDDPERVIERPRTSKSDNAPSFQSDAFNAFAAEFGTNKLSPGSYNMKSEKEELLEAEVERLKEQLKQANVERSEVTSKYEKLSAICRSQRQEIQELKQAIASRTPSPNKNASKSQPSPGVHQPSPSQLQKVDGTVWERQEGLFDKSSPSPDHNSWKAFSEDSKPAPQPTMMNSTLKSVRTRNGHQNKQSVEGANNWGFGTESFTAIPASNSQVSTPNTDLNYPQHFGESRNVESKSASQPAGWAGF